MISTVNVHKVLSTGGPSDNYVEDIGEEGEEPEEGTEEALDGYHSDRPLRTYNGHL